MDNRDVNAFCEIVKQGSFSKASKTLYITQSTLSSKIKNLEDELGCQLFYRKKGIRNITLTEAGKKFLTLVDRWNNLWNEMTSIKNQSENISFMISSLNSVSNIILPKVFLNFLEEKNNIQIKTEDLASYESYNAIENRYIDFAIIADKRNSPKVNCNPLFAEDMIVVSNINSKLPKNIDLEDLELDKFIYCPWFLKFEQWCQLSFGKNFKPFIQLQIISQILYMLENKDCWSILPKSTIMLLEDKENIQIHEINFEIPKRNLSYIVLLEETNKTDIISEFLKHLKDEILELEKNNILISKL